MIFEQYYLECLSQASYLIGDETTGIAVVVDPRRDVGEYLAAAEAHGLQIGLVMETHFHADFLSGHVELARLAGAEIAYGEAAEAGFAFRRLRDGERIRLGEVTIEVMATPGHTPESISLVVWEHPDDEVPYGVLTGDTLFIGDVGRPDLLSAVGASANDLARQLYQSLHGKLLTLPDETRVYPAHGAGSSCGKNLSSATVSTIGEQRATNYALAPMTEDEFVAAVTEGQSAPPAYFGYDAALNRVDHETLDETTPPRWLYLDDVLALQAGGALVLDTRDATEFAKAHLAGSINVGLGGRYAEYAGCVVPPDRDVVLVTEEGAGLESRVRLARIGFDRVVGCLERPLPAFLERPDVVRQAPRLTATELADRMADAGSFTLLDVRGPGETRSGVIDGAVIIPLSRLAARLDEIDHGRPVVVYCAGGYRSSIAASLLRADGIEDVADLVGGYGAWMPVGAPGTPFGCSSAAP